MRRRDNTRGRITIPPEVLDEDGTYNAGWAAWCDEVGYSKLDFLREAVARSRHQARVAFEAEFPGVPHSW